jgi:flagellar hook assembly protein FlgD
VRYAYEIPSGSARVEVGVFDVAGRQIRSLVRGTQSTGRYEVIWDGRNDQGARVKGAVYFLRASVGPTSRVSRLVFLN